MIAASFVLLSALAGCGEESGVSEGATVTAYVAAPLCAEAEREWERQGARAGELRVGLHCLEEAARGDGGGGAEGGGRALGEAGKIDLATVGENARRASEDSTAVGYLEAPGRAVRFGRPILEAAGIAVVVDSSGAAAMSRLLDAIAEADPGSLRESVRDALE